MDGILKHNLEKGCLWGTIETTAELDLSLGEKYLLVQYLKKGDYKYEGWVDLWKTTTWYLWDRGYRSKALKEFREADKQAAASLFDIHVS